MLPAGEELSCGAEETYEGTTLRAPGALKSKIGKFGEDLPPSPLPPSSLVSRDLGGDINPPPRPVPYPPIPLKPNPSKFTNGIVVLVGENGDSEPDGRSGSTEAADMPPMMVTVGDGFSTATSPDPWATVDCSSTRLGTPSNSDGKLELLALTVLGGVFGGVTKPSLPLGGGDGEGAGADTAGLTTAVGEGPEPGAT